MVIGIILRNTLKRGSTSPELLRTRVKRNSIPHRVVTVCDDTYDTKSVTL